MLKNGCLFICLLACLFCHSQDLSNKGKDFWITYPAHVDGNTSVMGVYITSDQAASGTVQVAGTSIPFSITANSVKTIFIGPGGDVPNTAVYLTQSDGIATNAGIHVMANRPVVVYAHIIKQARSGATLLLPSSVWGKEYIVPSHGSAGQSGANSGIGIITIVAKDTNTVVEIDPKVASLSGRPAGTVYSILLSKPGDVYQVQYEKDGDISGTTVRSVATGNTTCKPIGVFSSSTWSAFDCATPGLSGDNLYQQLFPVRSFGKAFITSPFINRNYDIIRVFVTDPTTFVKRTENGVTTTLTGLQSNSFYEFKTNLPNKLDADKPISVVQYITSQRCFKDTGDPEMVILNPLEQTINNITVFSAHQKFVPAGQSYVNHCYLNIIIKTGAAGSFKINGIKPNGNFVGIPGTGYSYLQEDVSALSVVNPVQTLIADSSFSAIAYGYGDVESYGYNAGTNVRDLYQYISIKNQNATVNYPATCVNTPFQFGITLPYLATKFTWAFYGKFPDVTINNPVPDSSFVIDGKTLYRFKLNNTFSYNVIGSFPVSVTATNPSSDGCNGEQQIDYDLQVYEKPKASFTWSHSGCVSDPVQFHDSSNSAGATVNRWHWEFGDNTTDLSKDPVKKYSTGGSFIVKQSIITDVGCLADTTTTINISAQPVANFSIAAPYCTGSKIIFTDASTISQGTIKKWYWDFGNGNKDTVTTNTVQSPVYKSGTYTVSLVVESSTGCKSILFNKTFTVDDAPVPDFKLPQVVCLPAGQAVFSNQSTIINGNVNSLTYKWDFGDGVIDNAIDPVHIYKSAGPFTIKLTATSSAGCSKDSSKIFSNIFAQPVADFTTAAQVCLGDTSVFTDASSTANQTIVKYGWNLGNSIIDSTKNITRLYAIPATYQVRHWVVSDKGCLSDTVIKAHAVNPLPTASFTITGSACENKPITFTNQSIANAGTINRWQWNMGDGATIDGANGNAFQYSYNTLGNKTVKLVVTSNTGCISDTATRSVQVSILPVTAFGTPEICLSDAFAQFTDSSSISDGSEAQFTYLWNFGDANASAGNPNTSQQKDGRHKYTAAGNYTVTLSVASKDGCGALLTKTITVNGDKPKADFDILNNNICSNSAIQIINHSSVNFGKITKTEIFWEWPSTLEKTVDDEPATNKIYQHSYPVFQSPSNRTFTIRLLAYSGGVCVSEIIKTATTNAAPKVIFEQVPGFCPNASSQLITQATVLGNLPGNGSYNGAGINAAGLFDPVIAGEGKHKIQYRFVSALGCTDSAFQDITVWPAPAADFIIQPPACSNAPVNFKDASNANFGKLSLWRWSFGDGTSLNRSDSNTFQKTYSNAGSFTVQLQVETDSGCVSNLVTKPINIKPLPVVDFDIPAICVNTPAQFTDRSTIADGTESQFTYSWQSGLAGATSMVKNPKFNYPETGTYHVSLQVTSRDGCVNMLSKPITDIIAQPLANFDFTPAEICLGETITFTDKSNALNQTITNWKWNFDDGTTSALQHNEHKYTKALAYNVSLFYTTSRGCLSDTIVKKVIVNPIPVVNAGPDQFILQGGQKPLLATVSGSTNYQYRWTPAAGLNNPAILQPVASPNADVTYTLTVTSAGGCTASDMVFIKFVLAPVIPNAFSPNRDGINDVWGIKYLDSYPGSTINVFDRYGREVYAGNGSSKPWDGDFRGKPLPTGVYYYVVDPKNGKPALTGSLTIIR